MNLLALHITDKPVSAIPLFKGELGAAIALQIKKGEQLKEHISKTPALLLCISGSATYEDEHKKIVLLRSGDYVNIDSMVSHKVTAGDFAQFVLLK